MKILVVDDDFMIRQLLCDILARDNVGIHYAFCFDQAVRMFRTTQYDVITLDYHLVGSNGFELLKKIKQESGHQPMVIMITAYAEAPGLRGEALRNGAHAVLGKPIPVHRLLQLIYGDAPTDNAGDAPSRSRRTSDRA